MKKQKKEKKEGKKQVGRPLKNVVKPIPDTPENVARALFGIKSDNTKIEELRKQARN